MRYRVIENRALETMIDEVNLFIVEDWVPMGGVAYNPDDSTFMQAVYLHEFDDTPSTKLERFVDQLDHGKQL